MRLLRYYLVALMVVLLLAGVVVPVFAAGTYSMAITATDNSSTDRVGVPILVPFNSTGAVAVGMMDSNGLYTKVFEGTAEVPYGVSNNSVGILATSLLANQSRIYRFETGYTPPQTFLGIIPGYGGYFTVADNTTLEPSGNFTLGVSAYTGTSTNLTRKDGALLLTDSGSGTVTLTPTPSLTSTLRPDGAGDSAAITSSTNATHWQAVNDNSDATYVSTVSTAYQSDLYSCDNISSTTIISVVFCYRIYNSNAIYGTYIKPQFKIGGVSYNGTEDGPVANVWTSGNQTFTTSPATGLPWTVSELNATQIGLWLKTSNASGTAECSDIWLVVNRSLSVSGIANGLSPVVVSLSSNVLTLQVGSGSDSAAYTSSTANTSNNWIFAAPYFSSVNITVGGTLRAQYQPNTMIIGTNLPDLATGDGVSNNGTITWGTNDHVSLVVGGLKSLTSYLPAAAESVQPTPIPAPGSPTPESTVEDPTMPWYSLFQPAATALGWGTPSLYGIMGIFAAMGIGVGVGIATGSALLAMIAVGLGLTVGVGQGVVGLWVVLAYGIFSISFLAVTRSI